MSTPPFITLPAGVETVTLTGSGGQLACLIATPLPGRPVRGAAVLVPGLTGSKEDFIAVLPLLRDRGWIAASLDLRGQFESITHPNAGFELADFASDVGGLIRKMHSQTGQPVHLVGHSFGGLVARETVLRTNPATADTAAVGTATADPAEAAESSATSEISGKLPLSLLASLTLLSSGPGALPEAARIKVSPLLKLLPATPLERIWSAKEALDRAHGTPQSDPRIADFLKRRFLKNDPRGLRAKAVILSDEPDRVTQLRDRLATGQLPAMVVFGECDDAWTTAEQREMAHDLNARLMVFPATGHSPNTDRPDWLAAALDHFWSEASDRTELPTAAASCHTDTSDPDNGISEPDHGYETGMEIQIPVAPVATSVSPVRRSFARALRAWGFTDQVDDAELVISELITNAIRHGRSPIKARLILTPDALRIEVSDGCAASLPTQREADLEKADLVTPGGLGIPLISTLSRAWGVETNRKHKTVWAELAR